MSGKRHRYLTVGAETLTMMEWSKRSGVPYNLISQRLRLGWPEERAIFEPSKWGQNARHGGAYRAEYRAWQSMRDRCENPNHEFYEDYGGRGLSVCEEWKNSFEAFFAAVGPRPSPRHSLGRIKNHLGYQPGNVRWETAAQQMRNKRNNIMLTVNGRTQCMKDWAIEVGLSYGTLMQRIHSGWTAERAVLTPRTRLGPYSKERKDLMATKNNAIPAAAKTLEEYWHHRKWVTAKEFGAVAKISEKAAEKELQDMQKMKLLETNRRGGYRLKPEARARIRECFGR